MNKYLLFLIFLSIIFSIGFVVSKEENQGIRKIIVFQSGLDETDKDKLIRAFNGVKLKNLDLIGAKAVWLPDKAAAEKLAKDPRVLRVDDDIIVETLESVKLTGKGAPQPSQQLTWNIDRVDAELVWSFNTANPIKVGVLDTGISNKHPDLTLNIKGGYNTINPNKSWNDDNGHGSHVAGIIAALNNSIGVVGVGPEIDLYAIKVLNAAGTGYLSDVIEGIQWAVNNGMQVLNMSLGTSQDSQSLHDAITQAYNSGMVLVAAAGNNGGSVIYPAAYPEVIAVSATDQNNQIADWSSRGPEVDLAAPGVSIYSTYKGSSYATLSGTSMAAPHGSGVAALILNTPVGTYDTNENGKWDPDEVKAKLCVGAVDLGDPGVDNLYGCGLVNTYNSLQ